MSMDSVGETIFWKKNGHVTDSSGTWDDTELIKAYDKAVAELKGDSLSFPTKCKQSEEKKKKQKKKKKKSKDTNDIWKAGGQCLALYSEDGLYYEATILSVNNNKKTVEVRFAYYENEEEVDVDNLLPIENKSQMEEVLDSVNPVDYGQPLFSDNSHSTNKDSSNGHINWHVNDVCYILNKYGVYEKAVLNSFKCSELCHVTIVNSNRKKEIKVSQLRSSVPREYKRSQKNSRHCSCSCANGFQSDASGYVPPLPAFLPNPPFMNPPFINSSFSQQYPDNSYKNGMSFNIPKCPPLPTLSDDVIAGNEEALASMLMSWYISGFHTGYYQGMKQSSKNNYFECNGVREGERKKCDRKKWDKTLV